MKFYQLNNEQNIPVTDELLARYFAGEAGPAEAIAIDEWLEASAGNRQIFDRLRLAFENPPYRKPDVAAAYRQVESQLAAGRSRRWRTWAIAAAITFAVIGGTLAVILTSSSSPQLITLRSTGENLLPDQSSVVLQTSGEISYPGNAFRDGQRIVSLRGTGYFRVKADPRHPFFVQAGALQIKVVGTIFNVVHSSDSVLVQVTEGAVLLSDKQDSALVKTGQQCRYDKIARTFSTSDMHAVHKNLFSYATKSLYFEHTTLHEVIRELSGLYGVKITLENQLLANCTISTSFDNKPLPYVLDVITASLGLSYRTEGDEIYISGDECQ